VKAYVIGIQGRHRNPQLVSQLSDYFDVVVENGFRESNEKIQWSNGTVARAVGSPLSNRELACALAHQDAREWLVKSNEQHLAVFEDDCEISDENLAFVLDSVDKLNQLGKAWQLNMYSAPWDQLFTHWLHLKPKIRRSRIHPSVAVAYVISRKAAILLEEDRRSLGEFLEAPADASPAASGLLDIFITIPNFFKPMIEAKSLIATDTDSEDRSRPHLPHRGLLALVSTLASPEVPSYKKRGVLLLRVKPLKHLLSKAGACFAMRKFIELFPLWRRWAKRGPNLS